jgi:hypothetical protein
MQLRSKKSLAGFLLFLGSILWQAPLNAESPADALCERLYSDWLTKAKQALEEGKRDEALRFLLEATTITEQCASSPEPDRQRRAEENVLASALSTDQPLARFL